MAEITASMVKDLRDLTGAGMMDCKKALTESGGDVEAAKDWLRQKGLAKAASKADRVAKDGLIKIHKTDDRHGAMLLLACETDFVAKTDDFKALVDGLARHLAAAQLADEHLAKSSFGETLEVFREVDFNGKPISAALVETIAKVGENIQLGAVAIERSEDPRDYLGDYLHGKRVGVLVCVSTGKPETHADERFQEAVRDLAMQIAAAVPSVPIAVDRDGVDEALVEKERRFLIEQAKEQGKPQEIAEKMVEGRLSKYFEEVCLLEQPFVKDDKLKVRDYLAEAGKQLGDTISVARFHRFQFGE
jgi:elongation factor Ts